MKFCKNCGNQMVDEAVVCPNCGTQQSAPINATPSGKPDSSSMGYALLGCCWPLLGLILFLVWKDSTPLKAKSAGKGALVGLILSILVSIIYVVIVIIIAASTSTPSYYYYY